MGKTRSTSHPDDSDVDVIVSDALTTQQAQFENFLDVQQKAFQVYLFFFFFFFFRVPPSFNMLKIQAGEQEKSEIYIYICIYIFFVLGALQWIRAVICACKSNACKKKKKKKKKKLVISKRWNNVKSGYCS